jgi:uncharacterized protein (TIGR02001 family)
MRRTVLFLALACASGAASAASGSATFTFASDYLFDGVSQTQGDDDGDFNPAAQASFDISTESGFYFGVWGSNVDFADDDPADVEIDYYLGYTAETEGGWGWEVGALYYTYVGAPSSYDYGEGKLGVTFPFGTNASLFFGDDDLLGGKFHRLKLKHAIPLGETWSLNLEATRTNYDNGEFDDFSHGQIGVSREIGAFTAYFGYSDTDIDENPKADGRLLFTLATSIDVF